MSDFLNLSECRKILKNGGCIAKMGVGQHIAMIRDSKGKRPGGIREKDANFLINEMRMVPSERGGLIVKPK
jgi:hypothetical protein